MASISWKDRVDRDGDEPPRDDLASPVDDPSSSSAVARLLSRALETYRSFRARAERTVPRVVDARLDGYADARLKRIRDRCVAALRHAKARERALGAEDVEGGRGANVDDNRVESVAREIATGDEARARAADIVRQIDAIAARRKRRKETKYSRRIEAIPRDATRLIDEYSMTRFVHRGVDVEGLDRHEFKKLFDRCLEDIESESLKMERLIPVEHLLRLVRRGTWGGYWSEYKRAATTSALVSGVSGTSVALYAIADSDPLGTEEFEGIPDSSTLLGAPSSYLWHLFQLLTLPVLSIFLAPFVHSVRRTLHMSRFLFTSSAWRRRRGSSSFVALAIYYTPYWALGIVSVVWYFTNTYSDAVMGDGIIPTALAFSMLSFIAMALALADVKSFDKMSAVTLFFPGGRSELPDGESKIVQEHPTVDTLRVREIPIDMTQKVDVDASESDDAEDSAERSGAVDHGRRRSGRARDRPRWMSEMDDFADNVASNTVVKTARATMNKPSHQPTARKIKNKAKDSIEDIVGANKLLQLRVVTEKDVVTQLIQRTNEESWRSYWLSTKRARKTHMAMFFIAAFLISLVPFFMRGLTGDSAFGMEKRSNLCMRNNVTNSIGAGLPEHLDMAACPVGGHVTTVTALVGSSPMSVSTMDGSGKFYGVVCSFVWNTISLFIFFSLSRWLCACAYHDMLHWLFFRATTDPSLAGAYDVPYINLCQSWLPWIRIRMVVEDHRELEQNWVQIYLLHFITLVVGIVGVCLVKVLRMYIYYDITSIVDGSSVAPVYPLMISTVIMIPVLVISAIASKLYEIQEEDATQIQEARWKLFLDNSTILDAGLEKQKANILNKNERSIEGLKELERIITRRNIDAWPSVFGARITPAVHAGLYSLAFLSAVSFGAAVAIEIFIHTRDTSPSSLISARDFLRVAFTHIHDHVATALASP